MNNAAGGQDEAEDFVHTLLLLGKCYELSGEKMEAFRCYLNARYAASRRGNEAEQSMVLESLATFYARVEDFAKAKEYYQKQLVLDRRRNIDSAALMRTEIFLANMQFENAEESQAHLRIRRVIRYAGRQPNQRLLTDAFTIIRSYLVDHGKIGELETLYVKEFPEELHRIKTDNPLLHVRLMAFMAEHDSLYGNAGQWYAKADSAFPTDGANVFQRMRFQQRYGEFLLRQGDLAAAGARLSTAHELALRHGFQPFVLEAATLLDSLARRQGDYVKAYRYARLAEDARRQQQTAAQSDKLLQLELETEARTRALYETQAKEAINRRFNIQYTGIIIGIALLFLVILLLPSAHISPRKLRVISFLTFILLFEFIILIADLFFHDWTHGEPWKLILIKLVFIAGLSQVHHLLEHRLARYLAQHEPLTELRRRITSWWKRDTQHQTSTAPHPHPPVEPTESTDEIF